jgi:hypothetical protein
MSIFFNRKARESASRAFLMVGDYGRLSSNQIPGNDAYIAMLHANEVNTLSQSDFAQCQ